MIDTVAAVVQKALEQQTIVGSVIQVAVDGQVVHEAADGWFDREAQVPMRADAIFRIASFTKPMVAMTALAMLEAGLLQLEQPVDSVLPGFRPLSPDGSFQPITLRHLLTHTGGIGAGGPDFDRAGVAGGLGDTDLSIEENLERLASVKLVHAPGQGWVYGKGMDVMGGVIATIHGGTLGDALKHYVTGKLGMVDTGFVVTDRERLGPVYADNPGGVPTRMTTSTFVPGRTGGGVLFSPDRVLNPKAFQSGGSGAVSTAGDFLRFIEAMRMGGGPIVSPATMAMATQNHIGAIPREPGSAFCLVAALVTDPAAAKTPQPVGTYEWGGIWGHRWFVDPTNRISAVIMTNTANEGCSGAFPLNVRDAIYAALDKRN